jgi:hypothetical protein
VRHAAQATADHDIDVAGIQRVGMTPMQQNPFSASSPAYRLNHQAD